MRNFSADVQGSGDELWQRAFLLQQEVGEDHWVDEVPLETVQETLQGAEDLILQTNYLLDEEVNDAHNKIRKARQLAENIRQLCMGAIDHRKTMQEIRQKRLTR